MRSRFNPQTFLEVIQHQSDLDQTLVGLKRHGPSHVVAGFESGVELAELLSQRLGLPSNGSQLRGFRSISKLAPTTE